MGIEKQKMKQKEENVLQKNKKTERKMKTLQKQMSQFFQIIRWKKKITREEIKHKEKKQDEIKQKDVKTRRDLSDSCRFWSRFFSFSQKTTIFPDLRFGTLFFKGKICKHNVHCFRMFFLKELWKSNSMNWKNKEANWQIESPLLSSSTKSLWVTTIQSSSKCPTWLGRRTGTTIRRGRSAKSLERSAPTLAMFWNGNRLTERRWRCG